MKRLIGIGLMVVMVMVFGVACAKHEAQASESSAEETFKIGITQIVEHPALDAARLGFIEALKEAGYEDRVEFIEKNAQGDMPTAQVIAQSFVDEHVDMIYAIATPTAQAALNATTEIPIMISAVTDPVAAGLVDSNSSPNTNVSGTSDEAPVDLQLQLLKDLGVDGTKIGFIYNTSEKNSEVQLAMVQEEAAKLGMTVKALGITSLTELEQGIDVLLDEVDVIYTPTDNMVASGIQLVTNKALEKGKAVLGAESAHVEAGALATCGVDYFALGKQTGEMAVKVLEGQNISEMPVEKALNPEVTINMTTAEALGLELDDSLVSKSNILE